MENKWEQEQSNPKEDMRLLLEALKNQKYQLNTHYLSEWRFKWIQKFLNKDKNNGK